jgi:hypothetical protein
MAISLSHFSAAYAQEQTPVAAAPALPVLPENPIDKQASTPVASTDTPGADAPVSNDSAQFSAAEADAEQTKANPLTKKYLKETFYPTFSTRYSSVLKECFADPKASKDPFTIILALDQEGHVEKINLNTTTRTSDCMMKSLTLETFGPPPFVPFHVKVKMQFNQ